VGVVVGVTYPAAWERRSADGLAVDLAQLPADVEVLADVRYSDPDDVRVDRGAGRVVAAERFPVLTDAQVAMFGAVEVLLTQDVPPDVVDVAPNLRWVQCIGSSTSHLDVGELNAAGVRVTNAAGVAAQPIAEFVLARVLQVWKRLPAIDALQASSTWRATYGRELAGATMLIVGLGEIGTCVARLATAFGMSVIGVRRTPVVAEFPVHPPSRLPDLLPHADVVVAAVPETPETRGLFDERAFNRMNDGSVFVNVGRGSAVVEPDLLAATHLGAAILDVASTEPLPPDSPLWSAPGIHLSAHCAVAPDRYWERIHARFRDNLVRYRAGVPLDHEVSVR
jgi:phosphoglycerate dehydrogenase-like enzyme